MLGCRAGRLLERESGRSLSWQDVLGFVDNDAAHRGMRPSVGCAADPRVPLAKLPLTLGASRGHVGRVIATAARPINPCGLR